MLERVFDDTYNVREVLDDVLERISTREKLIQTAKQFSEKKREERFALAIRQFDSLMIDFLKLYQPMIDRIKTYRETLQKDVQTQKNTLATISGMIEVSRNLESLTAKVQRMEVESQELDSEIKEKSRTLEKIDDLLNRIRPFLTGSRDTTTSGNTNYSDILGGIPKDLYGDIPDPSKEVTRKTGSRNSS